MKIQILFGVLGWSIGFAACVSRYDAGTASVESSEIGICGANADPSTGVICKHTYSWEGGPTFLSSEIFERDSFDYVRCTYQVRCEAASDPRSTGDAACLSVIGTGCSASSLLTNLVFEVQLPPGTPASGKDRVCFNNFPTPQQSRATCTALNDQVEQGEDLCCLPRVPPPPPPGDGGVGADAGSAAGSDAAVDAGSGSGSDAGSGSSSGSASAWP